MPSKENTSEAVKSFVKLAKKWRRTRESQNFKYWEQYDNETSSGWMFKRQYPYRKAAQQAADREEELYNAACEIHENASAADREAIEAIDSLEGWYIVTC